MSSYLAKPTEHKTWLLGAVVARRLSCFVRLCVCESGMKWMGWAIYDASDLLLDLAPRLANAESEAHFDWSDVGPHHFKLQV